MRHTQNMRESAYTWINWSLLIVSRWMLSVYTESKHTDSIYETKKIIINIDIHWELSRFDTPTPNSAAAISTISTCCFTLPLNDTYGAVVSFFISLSRFFTFQLSHLFSSESEFGFLLNTHIFNRKNACNLRRLVGRFIGPILDTDRVWR